MKKRVCAAIASVMMLGTILAMPVSAQETILQDISPVSADTEIISYFGEISDYRIMSPEETDFLDFSSAKVPADYLCYGFTKSEGSDYPYKIIGVESFSLMAEVSCKNITLEQVRAVAATTIDDAYIFSCGQDQFGGVSGLIRIAYSADAEAGFEELVTAFIAALQEKNADVYSAKTYIHTTSDWFAPSNSFYLTYFTYTSHIEEDRAIVAEYIEKNALPWQIINYGKGGPFYVDLIGAPASPEQQLEMARRLYHELGYQMKYICPETAIQLPDINEKVLIEPQYAKGDVNMDGKVDVEDAQAVKLEYLRYITGYDCSFSEEQIKLATIVGHSTENPTKTSSIPFSVEDAQVLLQYYTCKDVSNVIDDNISVTDFWQNYDSYMPHEKQGDEIAFTEVAADYSKFSGGTELQKNNEAKSRVIYNSEQLANIPIQPVNPYSDAFFEDHALIFVCIVFQNMASDSPVITGIHCEDHSIQIAAEREFAPMEMVELWCTFLEVKKSDLPAADEEVVFDFDITEGDELCCCGSYTSN